MRVKLAGALIATLLVFGMVFGAGQAAAASLPGDPLYGLKLTAEQARMELTTDPEAKAELATQQAENRLGEIAQMVAEGEQVNREIAYKAQEQLMFAYQAMNQVNGERETPAQQRLTHMVQNQQRVMASAVDSSSLEQEPVRALMRSMVRVQAELQTAQGTEAETGRQYPELSDPAGQSGAGAQAGQQDGDGLVDGTGAQTGAGYGYGEDGSRSYGYGSSDPGAGSPYESEGPSFGLGPGESQEDTEGPAGWFGWVWRLFNGEATQSGSDSSSGGSTGSGSSGSGSSSGGSTGSGSSGSGSSGSGSSGSGSSGSGSSGSRP